ncbi:hypothetical protein PIB30_031566 [Stylosanthes scabra]|uniref:Uncharacterized protein n=1 Tax=Stylosanthes scabra TaxID=79078 RepID=A0ABU6RC86_9FABA|nr:hypothetical protein [Stylosanthes scabra]
MGQHLSKTKVMKIGPVIKPNEVTDSMVQRFDQGSTRDGRGKRQLQAAPEEVRCGLCRKRQLRGFARCSQLRGAATSGEWFLLRYARFCGMQHAVCGGYLRCAMDGGDLLLPAS